MKYVQMNKISEFNANIGPMIATQIKPYLDDKLAKGEKVAFLAFTRNTVRAIEDALHTLYPKQEVISLVPEKPFNSTIFSKFIAKFWDQVQYAPSPGMSVVVAQMIIDKLDFLVPNKDRALKNVQRILGEWQAESSGIILSWQTAYMNGVLSKDDFFENVKQNMLAFEIRRNAIRQALLSSQNEQIKQARLNTNAPFILSTIHSAKGLEFENTVVFYQNENDRMAEDKKRMYYVAFTRAMKSELILAYGTHKFPKIETDYATIVKTLEDKENGVVPVIVNSTEPDAEPVGGDESIAKARAFLKKQGYAVANKNKPDQTEE